MAKTQRIRSKVEQTGSAIARHHSQRATLIGLKLNKIGRVTMLQDTPAIRGMIAKVQHLVRVVDEKKMEHDPENWKPVFGQDHVPRTRKRTMKLSDIADNAGSRKKRMRVAVASAQARARPPVAAARARPRAPACVSRFSKVARCRCIGGCPKRGFNNTFRPNLPRSISIVSRTRSMPNCSTPRHHQRRIAGESPRDQARKGWRAALRPG